MNFVGFSFYSNGLQYSIAEKLDGTPVSIIERERRLNPAVGRIRETANWLHDTFNEVHKRNPFSFVGFKAHYDLNSIKDLHAHGLPIGVLASFCAEQDIPIEGFTARKIKGYKFLNLPKPTLTFDWLNDNHADGNMYWNDNARYSIAVAFHLALNN